MTTARWELASLSLRLRLNLRCARVVFASTGRDTPLRDLPADPRQPFRAKNPTLTTRVNPITFLNLDGADALARPSL